MKSGLLVVFAWLVLVTSGCIINGCMPTPKAEPEASTAKEEAAVPKAPSTRPNVVWIVLDACRAGNLSCYGYHRETSPNMDRLAKTGVLFEQNYSQGAWTRQSVPSYMTGRYFPVQCVYLKNEPELYKVPPADEVLFPDIMSENGYSTAIITGHAYFVPPARILSSFDESIWIAPTPEGPYQDFEALNEKALPWIEGHQDEPFFLYLHVLDTHLPSAPEAPYDTWLPKDFSSDQIKDGAPISLSGRSFSKQDQAYLMGAHDGEIRSSDDQVQRVVEKLEELDLLENTIIVIASDHGDALGEDGRTWGHYGPYHDELIHVPLIMTGPGIPENTRVSSLTENVDIVPTLIELLNLETLAKPDGKSLAPLMRDPEGPALHDYVTTYCIGQIIIRDTNYKYVRYVGSTRERLLNVPDRLTNRIDVTAQKLEELEKMRAAMDNEILPLLKQYQDLPMESPRGNFELKAVALYAEPKNAFAGGEVNPDAHADNKWQYKYRDGLFWSNANKEDAPPITFTHEVPNGRYRAEMMMYSREDFHGRPASAVMIKVEDEPGFTRIVTDYMSPGHQGYIMVPIGEYEIRDQSFTITIDESDKHHWAYFRKIVLTTIDADGVPIPVGADEDRGAAEEQLKALGYLE